MPVDDLRLDERNHHEAAADRLRVPSIAGCESARLVGVALALARLRALPPRPAPDTHALPDLLGTLRTPLGPALVRRRRLRLDELDTCLAHLLVGDGARQMPADEGARLKLLKPRSSERGDVTYATPALPAPLGEGVNVDSREARN